jgi:4a-hydroxytetrahydrobiopterin dehydratase
MEAVELTRKGCVPCRGDVPPLTPQQARDYLSATPNWSLGEAGKRLSRTFTFRDFREAMGFINRVADLAEQEGHHPDLAIRWNRVEVVLWTHKINGLHENDFIMAAKIDPLASG